jgi:hypothetical protein
MLVLKHMSSDIDMAYVLVQLQAIQAYTERRRTAEEAYLQGKELGVQVLRILENVDNLQPHVWIILQVAQYLVGGIPLKRKESRG